MVVTKTMIIGVDEYEIMHDAEMRGTELGSIDQGTGVVRMRLLGYDNRKVSKRMYFKVLMHEVVHGIDFTTMFVAEDKEENHEESENCIDLVTIYILKNLNQIVEHREEIYEDFYAYIDACESKIVRVPILFNAILDFIDDNPELIKEFQEVFK